MFALLTCLERHDLRLVAWAAAICLLGVATTLNAYGRAIHARGRRRFAWVSIAALTLGSGVWATHFMAMLAYHSEMPASNLA